MATLERDLHSRIVAWAKIILPLAALMILSTLFLFARAIDPEDAIPYADVDVAERIREPRLTAPTYSGVTSDGSAVTFQALEARPASGDSPARAEVMAVRVTTPDGGQADLSSAFGTLNTDAGLLTLAGGVTLTTSTGYRVETEAMEARLDRTGLMARSDIRAMAPMGQITAAGMTLQPVPDTDQYVMVFTGRVQLTYTPPAP
jgi:lipopolysaccharide export system protein LptC